MIMSLVSHLLKQRADVYRRTEVSDGQGGVSYSFVLIESNRKVKIDQASAHERFVAEQAGSSLTHKVYQKHDADIQRGDEYRQGSLVYRVEYLIGPSTPGVYRRVDVELIQEELLSA